MTNSDYRRTTWNSYLPIFQRFNYPNKLSIHVGYINQGCIFYTFSHDSEINQQLLQRVKDAMTHKKGGP